MKKIISLILVFVMLTPAMQASCQSDNTDYSNYMAFAQGLGALVHTDSSLTVTRAEFIDMVVKAMGYNADMAAAAPFSDTASSKYCGAIAKAAQLGIISGDGSGVFKPDAPLSYAAAIKITVSALGYTNIANARGGYPAGYQSVAAEIGLKSGIADNKRGLTMGEVSLLIYNFVTSDMCIVTGIKDGYVSQKRGVGQTILTSNYGYNTTEGILKTSGRVTMIPGENCTDNKIAVGSQRFNNEAGNVEHYLGYYVTCWYDDSGKAKLVFADNKNSSVTVEAKDICEYKDYVLTSYDEDSTKEHSYKLSKSVTVVRNGRNIIQKDTDFLIASGSIELIDNDGDKRYDVAVINRAQYMVVRGISTSENAAYDNKSGNSLSLKNDDDLYTALTITDKNGNYSASDVSVLSEGSVIMLYRSDDSKYTRAVACCEAITGEVSESYGKKAIIGGNEYELNEYFLNNFNLTPGLSGKFLLAPDGTLTSYEAGSVGDMKYGYLVDFAINNNGLEKLADIAILTDSGTILYTALSDKLVLNGEGSLNYNTEKDETKITSLLLCSGVPSYQVIKYAVNSKGQISKLDTLVEADDNEDAFTKYNKSFFGPDSLTRYLKTTKTFWHAATVQFAPHAIYGANTILFSVPYELLGGIPSERIDEKYFEVIGKSDLNASNHSYYVDAYDMDSHLQPAAMVIYEETSGSGAKVNRKTTPAIVEAVTNGFDSEANEVKLLTFWRAGVYYKCPIDEELYEQLAKAQNVPSSGDIVRLIISSDNRITALSIDADYNPEQGFAQILSSAPKEGQVGDSYSSGRVLTHSSSSLVMRVEQESGFDPSYSDVKKGDISPFIINSNVCIAVYDTKTNTVRQGRTDMLADGFAVGEENASRIIFKSYSNGIEHMFIYE